MSDLTPISRPLTVGVGRWRSWFWVFPGFTMVLVGAAVAITLLDGVMEKGDLSLYDPAVTTAVIADRSVVLTTLAWKLTFLGSAVVLVPLTVIVLTALVIGQSWRLAASVAVGMASSLTLTLVLKNVVGRARPAAVDLVGVVDTGFAFPSGHTLNATVFYGLMAGLLALAARTVGVRVGVVVGWLVLAAGVGASRVYLGYHWMTDVMGWALGIAVLGAVVSMTAVLWGRHPVSTRAAEIAVRDVPTTEPDVVG